MILGHSGEIFAAVGAIFDQAVSDLAGRGLERHQQRAHDLAWLAAERMAAERLVAAARGEGLEAELAALFLAELYVHTQERLVLRGIPSAASAELSRLSRLAAEALEEARWEEVARRLQSGEAPRLELAPEHQLLRATFAKLVAEEIQPIAGRVHREDLLVPDRLIERLAAIGCFGLSIPEKYGGTQSDHRALIVATEELTRGSLGIGGGLITRPEVFAKALLEGGSEAQKEKWLRVLAGGEKMCAVAVTEPGYGSDVARIQLQARRVPGGYVLDGRKTWCTFAGRAEVLLVLARTDPDRSKLHRGLSLFIVEKPRFDGREFSCPGLSGRAIPTIGYRGLHSFELVFEELFVPEENLVGEEGRGFYLQMKGFSGGRLQTAARAIGLMQAAYERALDYTAAREVFGKPIGEYSLSRVRLARMAMLIYASRLFALHVADLMDQGGGQMEASLVKLWASRNAEWVTREALQLHGGYGYAEEFDVSRYFVDARVLSLFEGTEEVLALKVIAPALLEQRR